MRIDVIPAQTWIEVDVPSVDRSSYPPSILIPITLGQVWGDRRSEFQLEVELKYSVVLLGSKHVRVFLEPGRKQDSCRLSFPVDLELQQSAESERQRLRAEDLNLSIHISGHILEWSMSSSHSAPMSVHHVNTKVESRLSMSAWKDLLGLAGHRLVPMSGPVLDELETIRRSWGLFTVEEVLLKFLQFYKGEKPEISQQLLLTLYETKTIRDKLAQLTERSATLEEVRVASLYLDGAGAEYLIKMLKSGVRVKLVTRKADKKAHADALSTLKQMGADVRIDNMLHARMMIFDDIAAIVTSADLDSEGLNNQKQAGIYTTDKVVVREALSFFDKVWEGAEKF